MAWALTVAVLLACAGVGMTLSWRERRDRRVAEAVRQLFEGVDVDGDVIREQELDALPEPVARWLRFSGVVGRRHIRTYRMRQIGRFRTGRARPWMHLHAEEYYAVEQAEFVWNATILAGGVVPIAGLDTLFAGRGRMHIQPLYGLTVADATGPEVDQGELMRWFSQIIWFPTFALSPRIRWEELGPDRVAAAIEVHRVPLRMELDFAADGRLVNVHADRYRDTGDGFALSPWSTPLESWDERAGLRLAVRGRGVWNLPDGDFTYVDIEAEEVEYDVGERLPREPGMRLVWPLAAVLLWNVAWMPHLPDGYAGDAGVPAWLLITENGLRIAVFAMPILLYERGEDRTRPWALLGVGMALYFASWIPLLAAPATAGNPAIALGPAITPALFLGAIAWLSRSWTYGALVAAFLLAHLAHQLLLL